MKPIRIAIIAVAIACAIATTSRAEDRAAETPRTSLEFSITDQFTLTSYESGMVAIRRTVGENRIVRFGAGFAGYYETQDDETEHSERANVVLHYLVVRPVDDHLSIHWGGGPAATIDGRTFASGDDHTWSFAGIESVLGADWNLTAVARVFADYVIPAMVGFTGADLGDASFHIASPEVRFGLAVAF